MISNHDESPPRKRANVSNEHVGNRLPPLDQFSLVEVLGNDIDRKSAFLHIQRQREGAEDEDSKKESAVVILDKKPFCEDDFVALLDPTRTKIRQLMENDIYGAYEVELPPTNSALKATIIYPATSKHIDKYVRIESVIVSETKEDYEQITLPYITQSQFSTQWVENVLNGTAEKERVFYTDSEFILAPDLKWDGVRLENLYITAICHQRGLKSIRDLDSSHLPLLRNIYQRGTEAIVSKYKVSPPQLRVFVHYQPSYYHFHDHFVHVMHEAVGTAVAKAHLLSDIIDNIELCADYYQKKTLYYTLKTNDPLLAKFNEVRNSEDTISA